MAKQHLYDDSPSIKNEGDGGAKVVKAKKKEHVAGPKEKGVEALEFPMHTRHETERKDMHARHETEMKQMHTRHQKEAGATGGSTDGEPAKEVEKGMKKE